jgi:hypothetical protein
MTGMDCFRQCFWESLDILRGGGVSASNYDLKLIHWKAWRENLICVSAYLHARAPTNSPKIEKETEDTILKKTVLRGSNGYLHIENWLFN